MSETVKVATNLVESIVATLAPTYELLRPEQWDSPLPTIPFTLGIIHSLASSYFTPESIPNLMISRLTEFCLAFLVGILINPLPDHDIQTFTATVLSAIASLGLIKTSYHVYHSQLPIST